MLKNKKENAASTPVSLAEEEEREVEMKIKSEQANFQHKVVNIGGILNPIAGLFIVLTLQGNVSAVLLYSWYFLLFLTNAVNVFIAYQDRHLTPDKIRNWRNALRRYHVMIALLCLAWGSVGILYTGTDARYQLFVITFLELLIIGFNFGTVTDIVACTISNIFLLIPYFSWNIYAKWSGAYDIHLNFSYGVTLIILALFSYMATFVGYILVKKFFRLNFEKVLLSQKLQHANKFLEERVKERTMELEDSLKLVTHQATHDLLTNLPNQRLLLSYVQSAIESAYRKKQTFAVVSFFLNEVDKINDAHGHQAGDLVINAVAKRLERYVEKMNAKNQDTIRQVVALTRKDIFVLIEPLLEKEEVEEKTEKLFSLLQERVFIDKQAVKLTASIGVCLYPHHGRDVKSLLMNADAAMSRAKQRGGNSLNVYQPDINADTHRTLEIENCLHSALKNKEFKLQFQPFINLKTGCVSGGEALIRWNSPQLGKVPPDKFIPLAEADGIIIPLGEWVLRSACEQLRIWKESGFDTLKISINLSAKQLHQKSMVSMISEIIQENKIDPRSIELELTETAAFKEDTIPVIKQLKSLGLGFSIDDFGTGYSGLSNLKLISIDKLKIDKSFIQDLATNSDSQAIVSNTIALAKKINVTVIAEGVETKEQLDFLIENGCNMVQGYYFSPPVDAEAFTELLKNKRMEN